MRYDEPRHVWTSVPITRTSEREGKGYCVKGGWREGEERVKERVRRSVNPIPNPDPHPKQATVVCFDYCSTYYKAVRGGGGGGNNGGHLLLGTTSRGLCGLVCPSRTSDGTREEPST
jgi:hypothetical protein